MEPRLIGYFPKRRVTRSTWISPEGVDPPIGFPVGPPVEDLCSVSHCIAIRPQGSGQASAQNRYGGYDDPASAWEAVPPDQRADFSLYAFLLLPRLFQEGIAGSLEVDAGDDLEPLPASFEPLGYDAVELTFGQCLGCSPLSCNGLSFATDVNRYCLVDREEIANELARGYSITKPEPGPYCVVEVWRDRAPAPQG